MTLKALALISLLSISHLAVAQNAPNLLIWINGDKGYNGLQKVGDNFTKVSGVKVVVQHPEGAPDKFQAAAGQVKVLIFFAGPTIALVNGPRRD